MTTQQTATQTAPTPRFNNWMVRAGRIGSTAWVDWIYPTQHEAARAFKTMCETGEFVDGGGLTDAVTMFDRDGNVDRRWNAPVRELPKGLIDEPGYDGDGFTEQSAEDAAEQEACDRAVSR
jgi:hypothetical protein